jgi:hypothetical protein
MKFHENNLRNNHFWWNHKFYELTPSSRSANQNTACLVPTLLPKYRRGRAVYEFREVTLQIFCTIVSILQDFTLRMKPLRSSETQHFSRRDIQNDLTQTALVYSCPSSFIIIYSLKNSLEIPH